MKTRIKFRDMPGDIPKCEKIDMLEGRPLDMTKSYVKRAKSYKKMIRGRERAVLKKRFLVRLRNENV